METKSDYEICELGDNKRYAEMTADEIDRYIEILIGRDRDSEERLAKIENMKAKNDSEMATMNEGLKDYISSFKAKYGLE